MSHFLKSHFDTEGPFGLPMKDAQAKALEDRFGAPVEAFDPFKKIAFDWTKLGVKEPETLVPTAAVAVVAWFLAGAVSLPLDGPHWQAMRPSRNRQWGTPQMISYIAKLSEDAAKDAGFDVVTSKHRYIGNGRALIIGEPDGMVKIIARKDADGRAGQDADLGRDLARSGRVIARCGHVVTAASLTEALGPPCALCGVASED
jgi:hypothetical protein